MKYYEIGTGYTPIPAEMGAATEIVVEELAKAMLRRGMDVTVIDIAAERRLPHDFPILEVPVPERFRGTDVQLGVMHKAKRVIYSINLARVLEGILRETSEKVYFHFHNQYNAYFFLLLVPSSLRRKCCMAYTNHSYIWFGSWNEIEKTVRIRYFQEIRSMKKADPVFVLNEGAKRQLTDHLGISADRIRVVDDGVNTEIYRPLSEEARLRIRRQQDAAGKRIFVNVGSVCERKNQLEAMRMLMPFMKADPNVMFLYAGGIIDAEYKEKLDRYAARHGVLRQIQYLGELAPGRGLNDLYNIADAMIFPSLSESFSLVIAEALSAGTPVVIRRDLVVPLAPSCETYADRREFQNIIKNRIWNPETREALSKRGRESVEKRFSWDKIAEEYFG